jgi:hypothetical protein
MEGTIKMDLSETGFEDGRWIELVEVASNGWVWYLWC